VRAQIVLDEHNFFGVGKMRVGEFLQRLRVFGGGVAVGDLGPTPALQSGAKIMNRLATPLRSYSWSCRAGRPGLAGIGVRVSSINCWRFRPDTRADERDLEVPWRRRCGLSERPSFRIIADLFDDVQFDDLLFEQAQAPAGEPFGRRRAGQCDQFGFRRPVENPRPRGVRITSAPRLEPFLDESPPNTADILDAGYEPALL
jgi:hypothetical protein